MTEKSAAMTLIEQLPKAELHLHIEGTLEPSMLLSLAQRNKVVVPYQSEEAVHKAYQFDCLQDFLDLYYLGMSVLVTDQDFYDLTKAYLDKVASQNVVHTEIFFDPQAHTDRGIAFDTVIDGITAALQDARQQHGMTHRLIMCFLRHLPEAHALSTLQTASAHRDRIFGVGLDSSEKDFPPALFSNVFAAAVEQGYVPVAHAGEEGPAAYVQSALDDLKVRRIDHGNRALEDTALTARLAKEQIPLTMCPLSNLRLCVIDSMADCPVRRAMQAGLLVTINSDDPSYFGGYLNENYQAVTDALAFSNDEVVQLAKNSFIGSFLPPDEIARHIGRIDQLVASGVG